MQRSEKSTQPDLVRWNDDRTPTGSELVEMTMKLPAKVRRVSMFTCSHDVMSRLKKARDENGNYLLMPSGLSSRATLIGYPIYPYGNVRGLCFGTRIPDAE